MLTKDHIPAFDEQPEFKECGGSVTRLDNEKLSGVPTGARFNGSIISWKGQRLLAYRQYNVNRRMTSMPEDAKKRGAKLTPNVRDIAISVLDENWQPTGEHTVVHFPFKHGDECYEDPRLFVFQDALWLTCAELDMFGKGWCVNQRVFRLNEKLQIEHGINIRVGQNFGHNHSCEKNWTFFTHASNEGSNQLATSDRLILLYNVCEMQTHQINARTGIVEKGWIDKKLFWPFGHMRGGTSPLPLGDGTYLKFVHNSTDHEWSAQGGTRRYSMSAVIFDGQPSFKILKVSKLPIVWGTRHEAFCGHGNSQCVFPAGVIIEDGVWHVSSGVNDTFNCIFHLDPDKVISRMVDASVFHEPQFRYFFTTSPTAVTSIAGRERLWRITRAGATRQEGIMATQDPFTIAELLVLDTAKELTKDEYGKVLATIDMPAQSVAAVVPRPDFKNPVGPKNIQPATPMPAETPAPAKPVEPPVASGYDLYDGIAHYIPAMDGWSSVNKCQRMAGDVLGLNAGISVDLGAFAGRVAISLGMAHRKSGVGVCYAIDAWDNAVAAEFYTGTNKDWWSKLNFEKIYASFLGNIDGHHLGPYIKVQRMKSEDATRLFADGSVSVLSFDADHSKTASTRDILAWMPKIRPGGYLYFDDTDWTEGGVCTTLNAQQILLDAGWLVTHTEPKNLDRRENNEWKIFQKPAEPTLDERKKDGEALVALSEGTAAYAPYPEAMSIPPEPSPFPHPTMKAINPDYIKAGEGPHCDLPMDPTREFRKLVAGLYYWDDDAKKYVLASERPDLATNGFASFTLTTTEKTP